jgi:hypothetical protein
MMFHVFAYNFHTVCGSHSDRTTQQKKRTTATVIFFQNQTVDAVNDILF